MKMKFKVGDKVIVKFGTGRIYSVCEVDNNNPEYRYKLKREDGEDAGWQRECALELVYTDPQAYIEVVKKAEYERGLDDAWEVARQLRIISMSDIVEIFDIHKDSTYNVIEELSASEAVIKWKAWKDKNKIKVGDEVILNDSVGHEDEKVIVLAYDGTCHPYNVLLSDGSTEWVKRDAIECKTGRHFDAIEEILNQLYEDQK